MVAKHPKKGFKTTVSIVSSNVMQKVVTIKNSCSHSATPPPPPPPAKKVPAEVRLHGNGTIREDLCCGPPLPLTILISDDDTASELSFELSDDLNDRPSTPDPRPKNERKTLPTFCFAESSTTCALPSIPTNNIDWPSDEEPDDEESNYGSSALPFAASQYLPSPNFDVHSVCGQFWSTKTQPNTTPNSWGLLITDRDDNHEVRASTSLRDDGFTQTGSAYEYREPLAKLNESPYFTF